MQLSERIQVMYNSVTHTTEIFHTKYESSIGQLLSSWDTGRYFGPAGERNHACDVDHVTPCPAFIPAFYHVDTIHVTRKQEEDFA